MRPELFEIPFIDITLKSYGLMMVIGFLAAVSVIRRLSRNITPDPQMITNAALYSLIGGVVGARMFYVIHYYHEHFKENLLSVFAIWHGGLELLGGVVLAITIIFVYLIYHKLPVRHYLDVLAIGLMLALVFGRVGCLMNGCCYGKPTELPWGIRFPYNSIAYLSQINSNLERNRLEPQLKLPKGEYFGYIDINDNWHPKPFDELTEQQKQEVTKGRYRCLLVHPTQIYSSITAVFLCFILYLFWRRSQKGGKVLTKPGSTFALMLLLYGTFRFFIEFLRDDNPYEFNVFTISQIIGISMIVLGTALMVLFQKMKRKVSVFEKKKTAKKNK